MKTYALLSESERWLWHADVYAFRRIMLGISEHIQSSPADPNGQWFDARLIAEAERRLHAKLNGRRDAAE